MFTVYNIYIYLYLIYLYLINILLVSYIFIYIIHIYGCDGLSQRARPDLTVACTWTVGAHTPRPAARPGGLGRRQTEAVAGAQAGGGRPFSALGRAVCLVWRRDIGSGGLANACIGR